jgi:hypothetical protein
MKLDKEQLIKHHFWLVLAAFLVLFGISFSVLLATAGDPIKKHKQQYNEALKKIKDKKDFKNSSFLKPWEEYSDMFRHHKDVIWEQAWNLQKDLYTWPSAPDVQFDERRMLAPELLPYEDREKYRDRIYISQIAQYQADERLAPVELVGGGDAMLMPKDGFNWAKDDPPTREEMWLAQEDFWIKKEVLEIIRKIEDTTAILKGEQLPDKDLPEHATAHYRFRNESWELHLVLEKDGGDMVVSTSTTLKNIHPGKRVLSLTTPISPDGLEFRIKQPHKEDVKLIVTNEPLAWGHEAKLKKRVNLFPINPAEPFDVAQVWDWYTSPIKRVTNLKLAYESHRTSSATLKSNPALPRDVAEEESSGPPPGVQPGKPGGPAPAPPPRPGGPGGKMPTGGPGGDSTPYNGFPRNRYLQVTPQCRHLPLAMSLVVDQHYIPDVLAEVSNSRLRIQLTQVQIAHARIGPPGTATQTGPGKPPPVTGRPPGGRPPGGRPRPGGPGPGPVPPVGGGPADGGMGGENTRPPGGIFPPPGGRTPPPGGVKSTGAPSGDSDPNLVELGIYGIAALYERYDESKVAPVTPPANPPATTPPAVTPPATTAPATTKVPPPPATEKAPPSTEAPPTTKPAGETPPTTKPAGETPPASTKTPPNTAKPPASTPNSKKGA